MDQNSQDNSPAETNITPEQEAKLKELLPIAKAKDIHIRGLTAMHPDIMIEELKKAIEEKENQVGGDQEENEEDEAGGQEPAEYGTYNFFKNNDLDQGDKDQVTEMPEQNPDVLGGQGSSESVFNSDSLPSKVVIGLANKGIKIEVVDALMTLALFDEGENTLKVRKDADVEFVTNYIYSTALVDEEQTDQTDLTDEGSKVDLKQNEVADIDLSAVEPSDVAQPPAVDAQEIGATTPDVTLNQPNIIGGQNNVPDPQNPNNAPTPTSTPATGATQNAPASPSAAPKSTEEISAEKPWRQSDAWSRMQELQDEIIESEKAEWISGGKEQIFSSRTGRKMEDVRRDYKDALNQAAYQVKSAFIDQNSTPLLSPEEVAKTEREINKEMVEAVYKREYEAARELERMYNVGVSDKALELVRKAAMTRIGQRYLKMNKWVRLGLNTTLITSVGYAAGAMAAGAAIGWGASRLVRGGISLAASGGARAGAELIWNDEKVAAESKEKQSQIMQSSGDDYAAKKEKIINQLKKEESTKRKQKLYKAGVTVVAGAGAGLLAGLSEGVAFGKGGNILDNRVNPRKGVNLSHTTKGDAAEKINKFAEQKISEANEDFAKIKPKIDEEIVDAHKDIKQIQYPTKDDTAETYNSELGEHDSMMKSTETPNAVSAHDTEETFKSEPGELDSMMRATETPKTGGAVFENVEKADFVPEKGSTLWGGMSKVLENNDRFAKLSPEGKTFIQSTYLNKAIEDPEKFGFDADPDYGMRVDIGKKINFAQLFGDKDEFDKLIEKAEKLSDVQKGNIRANDEAIASWVKSHPGEKATPEKIDEILRARNGGSKFDESVHGKTEAASDSKIANVGSERPTPDFDPENKIREVKLITGKLLQYNRESQFSGNDPQFVEYLNKHNDELIRLNKEYNDLDMDAPDYDEKLQILKNKIKDTEINVSKIAKLIEADKVEEEIKRSINQMDKELAEIKSQIDAQGSSVPKQQFGTGLDMKDVSAPKMDEERILKGLLDREEQLSKDINELQQKIENATQKALQNVGNDKLDDIEQIRQDAETLRKMIEERGANSKVIHEILNSKPKVEDNFGDIAKGGGTIVGATVVGKMFTDAQKSPEQLQSEIDAAKARYAELKNEKPKFGVIQGGKTAMDYRNDLSAPKNIRSLSEDIGSLKVIKEALDEEVNAIYDERDWLGRVKKLGTNTDDWGLVRRLPAEKVLNFIYKNSKESGLNEQVLEAFKKNRRHKKLLDRVNEFMEHTNRTVMPTEGETIEDFMIRLGLKVREMYSETAVSQNENLKKAA